MAARCGIQLVELIERVNYAAVEHAKQRDVKGVLKLFFYKIKHPNRSRRWYEPY